MALQKVYHVIGIMSGTSLDGIDMAHCTFTWVERDWHYKINYAQTSPYDAFWLDKLKNLHQATGEELAMISSLFGTLVGREIDKFAQNSHLKTDFIASHGHTVFHQPEKGFSCQIGNGASIAAATGLPVICDFRSSDVAAGGQGAPLVPVGDRLLFHQYDVCLNIGGFANVTLNRAQPVQAFDICAANIVLNEICRQRIGEEYDRDGHHARQGKLIPELLDQLNNLAFYQQTGSRSLGKEWADKEPMPLVLNSRASHNDLLNTYCEHIAFITANATTHIDKGKLLITGGGVYNTYLIERLRAHNKHNVVVPEPEIIEYKEALIFALLGVLRHRGEINCLSSVTGAAYDTTGGCIYLPGKR